VHAPAPGPVAAQRTLYVEVNEECVVALDGQPERLLRAAAWDRREAWTAHPPEISPAEASSDVRVTRPIRCAIGSPSASRAGSSRLLRRQSSSFARDYREQNANCHVRK